MAFRRDAVRDVATRNELVAGNMGLLGHAVTLFSRWHPLTHDEQDEARQVGVFGLIRAAELWDESKGIQFSTYATTAILNRITRWSCCQRTMVFYPEVRKNTPPYKRMARHSIEFFNGEVNELNKDGAWDIEKLLGRTEPCALEAQEEQEELQRVVSFLSAEQIETIHLRFYYGWTLKIMASYLGITREAARFRVNAAVNRLRQLFKLPPRLPQRRR